MFLQQLFYDALKEKGRKATGNHFSRSSQSLQYESEVDVEESKKYLCETDLHLLIGNAIFEILTTCVKKQTSESKHDNKRAPLSAASLAAANLMTISQITLKNEADYISHFL